MGMNCLELVFHESQKCVRSQCEPAELQMLLLRALNALGFGKGNPDGGKLNQDFAGGVHQTPCAPLQMLHPFSC